MKSTKEEQEETENLQIAISYFIGKGYTVTNLNYNNEFECIDLIVKSPNDGIRYGVECKNRSCANYTYGDCECDLYKRNKINEFITEGFIDKAVLLHIFANSVISTTDITDNKYLIKVDNQHANANTFHGETFNKHYKVDKDVVRFYQQNITQFVTDKRGNVIDTKRLLTNNKQRIKQPLN